MKDMERIVRIENWRMALVPHREVRDGFHAETAEEILSSDKKIITAEIPGNFELDLVREGLLDEPYYADNILALQKLEHLHLWYFTEFEFSEETGKDAFLVFGGIDTASEIYLDGKLLGTTENMLIAHEFSLNGISDGRHELVVHIIPATVYARQFDLPLSVMGQPYNFDSLVIRKAPYMYGWDIMPRAVSAGLWKPVSIVYRPSSRIGDLYLVTREIKTQSDEKGDAMAKLTLRLRVDTDEDLLNDFTFEIVGRCGASEFRGGGRCFGSVSTLGIKVASPKFWMPRNYGEPNLYDVTVTLYYKGEVCDTQSFRYGIRVVELDRTSAAGDKGEFCFRVNGQKIFVLGTNWVPTDAFPSRQKQYYARDLAMLKDIGCNMVRWWGGNIYPEEEFFDFCDENGILVWQDFALGCASYPDDDRLCRLISDEATVIVRKFRNRASLALWSGDNECDVFANGWRMTRVDGRKGNRTDPNTNRLTREIIPRVLRENDFARPYLPSSPFWDAELFKLGGSPSEDHLWGPRDFFKGKYYSAAAAHFASETGYHGCPSPASLKKYIPEENLTSYGDTKVCTDRCWLTHAACMEPVPEASYAYRIPLMTRQIERIFGEVPEDLERYALESQISQAEAKKYFIERFRITKWRRTGILWWNLVDGWPQISDAIVSHDGVKKLAYSYIKRSQAPFCLMIDEPKDGRLTLYAVNDSRDVTAITYTVRDLISGETVLKGEISVSPDVSTPVAVFTERKSAFYLIEWEGSVSGVNHYQASIGDRISPDAYISAMKVAGFDSALEGFETI